MFDSELGLGVDAYDSSIDTSDGTPGIDASSEAFVTSSDEDGKPLAALAPTVDPEP